MSDFPVPPVRALRKLKLPIVGSVITTDEPDVPFTITDAAGVPVEPVSEFMREFSSGDTSLTSCRSYAYDLLRWWRWLAAVEVEWDRATRSEVRDLVRWLRVTPNPQRRRSRPGAPAPGTPNAKTGKLYLAEGYAPTTINHQLTVLETFYGFHLGWGRGPLVNPVPSAGGPPVQRRPTGPVSRHRRAAYRQKVPERRPRGLSDELWTELFAAMRSNRDRAILSTYISSGVRASELLGMACGDIDFGGLCITVVGKGTREREIAPVSPDALVWIRLYLAENLAVPVDQQVPADAPLWVTLRRPTRPLRYDAMRRVLQRANDQIGANVTLHDLRHTCATRMIADPNMSITDVQAVLRHKSLLSTQIYARARLEELIERVNEHYVRLATAPPPRMHPAYDQADLDTLFGDGGR